MSGQQAAPVIDTHVILRDGDKILLSQRGGPYGHGRWHMPSGKLDHGEPLPEGAARELSEETGITVDPTALRLVQVVHHRQNDDVERIGFFFEALQWEGEPVNKEPDKCMALTWFTVRELPDDIIEYPQAGLLGYLEAPGLSPPTTGAGAGSGSRSTRCQATPPEHPAGVGSRGLIADARPAR